MNKIDQLCCESNTKIMERSPSPEPFKEPDGMVTIDLNRQSSTSCPLKGYKTNSNKLKSLKVVFYIIVICFFCLTSFFVAAFIHSYDVKWFVSKFVVNNDEEIIHGSPKFFKSEWNEEPSIEQQTCPLDFRDQYKIQLIECEKSQTFSDCCDILIRSNLPEINEVCSVIELLNLLTEYRKLFPRRRKRQYDTKSGQYDANYIVEDHKKDIQHKLNSKIKTETKIMSYLQKLDEPLRKELPALWNWVGELFFKKNDEDELYQLQPIYKVPHENHDEYPLQKKERPYQEGLEVSNPSAGAPQEFSNDKKISPDDQNFFYADLVEMPNNKNIDQINEPYSPFLNKLITTVTTEIAANYGDVASENNEYQYIAMRSNTPIENVDISTQKQYSVEHVKNYFVPEGIEYKNSGNQLLSFNAQQPLHFQDEYNKNVTLFPKYFQLNVEEEVVPSDNFHDVISNDSQQEILDGKSAVNGNNEKKNGNKDLIQTNDFFRLQDENFLEQPKVHPTREDDEHPFITLAYDEPSISLRRPKEHVEFPINYRRKRDQMNDMYSEYSIPMEREALTMPEYSKMQKNVDQYNPDNLYTNDYRHKYSQFDENIISPNDYYEEKLSSNFVQNIENDPIITSAAMNSLKGDEYGSNTSDGSYHSLTNGETNSVDLDKPFYGQTDERDIQRETWKEYSTFHLPQSFQEKQANNEAKNKQYPSNTGVENKNIENYFRKLTNFSDTLPTIEASERSPTRSISNREFERNQYNLHQINNTFEESSPQIDPDSNANISQVPTERIDGVTIVNPKTNVLIPSDPLDATDSIQSIKQIHANNKSVRVDFENTKIILQGRKQARISPTDETIETHSENNDPPFPSMKLQNKSLKTLIIADKKLSELPHSESFQRGSSNLEFRGSPQQTDFGLKSKGNSFSSVNEDVQSSQNSILNNCVYSYPSPFNSPYRYAIGYDNPQVLNVLPTSNVQKAAPVYVINPSVFSYIPPSPIISHYGAINQNYNPYGYVNPIASVTNPNNVVNGAVQVAGANGQYYLCNPIPTSATGNIANVPGVEIRRVPNLQKSSEDMASRNLFRNLTRAALNCPMDEQSCLDGSKCISERHVCDNEVHCEDGSDEMFCSCRDRIGEIRLCDGYYDCPDGEDERGCFGCADDEISCDDWSRFRKGSCVLMDQRCDGIRQCDVTGKDEDDCSILTDHMGERNPIKISNAVGFLHRNYKGKWYPTCFGSELWAMDVCKTEAGPSTMAPKSHLISTPEKYEGEFVNILPNQEMGLVNTCVQGRGAFVECPPLFCGLRMTVKNPYRSQELDTSIEELMNNLNRGTNSLDESFESMRNVNAHSNDDKRKDFLLGNERVVGGKASQPAAWPWVVSIYKNGIFHCGGVIINELWVVTAAHCVDRYWQFYYEVQAGILRRFSYSPMEQTRWVVVAIAHEDYEKSNLKNDVALMRLSSPVRYNRYVRPICLPSETTAGQDFLRGPSPGTICTTVGWGATVEHGTDPDHMREVQVPILKRCKHREDEEGNEICAGLFEGGKDACQGDSGGPFMCQNPNNPNQWYLAGIVSHGEGCARPNEPGVYTRVSQYIGWIAENIREGNFFPRTPLHKCPGYICRDMNKCIPKKRRCDKIVDCLMGDDESNCENSFHNIFKHSRRYGPFFRFNEENETSRLPLEDEIDDKILSAAVINAEDVTEVTTEVLDSTTLVDIEQTKNDTDVVHRYERKIYSNNNTADPDIFRCDRMLQIIPIKKRCNKIVDCEDGTDEENCACIDYVYLEDPNAICDGEVDCRDRSDEGICYSCKEKEFNCKKSRMCISSKFRCNGKPDCKEGEDESDCIALTNGKIISVDSDLRPYLRVNGIVSVNTVGIWRPYCSPVSNNSKSDAEIATGVCNYLGFEEYTGFRKLSVNNESLVIKSENSMDVREEEKLNSTKCQGLYLWCSNITLNNNAFDVHVEKNKRDFESLYNAPWNTMIYAGGVYKCMGALLNDRWVITSAKCFDGILMYNFFYLAVSLGKGLKNLNVAGPHEQILKVIKSVEVNETDIVLLKLEESIDFDRYIQATHLSLSSSIADKRDEKCMALGIVGSEISMVYLRSNKTCSPEHKCFASVQERNCPRNIWSGVITCNSGNGWYPASVFQVQDGVCEFTKPTKFTNIKYWARDVNEITISEDRDSTVSSFLCDGYLCKLGNCIERNKVCDGIPHCRMNEDEDSTMCRNRDNSCHLTSSCVCPNDHLTCGNGLCVPKEKFCDRNNDCGDFTDEPNICTCRFYMSVVHPEKICDGKINCFDRSDEDPKLCPCALVDFKCERSGLCVSNERVCDGIKDCPAGEDESRCYSLVANDSNPNVGEVLTTIAGQVLKSCFVEAPTRFSLNEMCQEFGFSSCIGHQLKEYGEDTNTTLIRIPNTFDIVWIRRDRKMPLMYRMRTGNNDHLAFRKQTNCHSLHVECI